MLKLKGDASFIEEQHISEILDLKLYQDNPNPFNTLTIIFYIIPIGSYLTLKVFNLFGNQAVTLVEGKKPGGNYSLIRF